MAIMPQYQFFSFLDFGWLLLQALAGALMFFVLGNEDAKSFTNLPRFYLMRLRKLLSFLVFVSKVDPREHFL